MHIRRPHRPSSDDEILEEDGVFNMGVGSVMQLTERPTPPRKRIKKRPMGFCRDIEKLEDAD